MKSAVPRVSLLASGGYCLRIRTQNGPQARGALPGWQGYGRPDLTEQPFHVLRAPPERTREHQSLEIL